jgi:hypothetical protein
VILFYIFVSLFATGILTWLIIACLGIMWLCALIAWLFASGARQIVRRISSGFSATEIAAAVLHQRRHERDVLRSLK